MKESACTLDPVSSASTAMRDTLQQHNKTGVKTGESARREGAPDPTGRRGARGARGLKESACTWTRCHQPDELVPGHERHAPTTQQNRRRDRREARREGAPDPTVSTRGEGVERERVHAGPGVMVAAGGGRLAGWQARAFCLAHPVEARDPFIEGVPPRKGPRESATWLDNWLRSRSRCRAVR